MRKTVAYILVITIMIIIFLFSNEPATNSTETSDNFILFISKILNINIEINDLITHIFRKSAHLTLYFILGITSANLIICYKKKILHILLISLIICFIYATFDEIHQLFIIGRSCEVLDIFIDTIGSILGILSYIIIFKLFNKEALK